MNDTINVCIGGVNGYTGAALVKLILQHPQARLSGVLVRQADTAMPFMQHLGVAQPVPAYTLDDVLQNKMGIDVLLLATPPQASIDIVTALQGSDINIIDLSGAFRLPHMQLEKWYGLTHTLPALQNGAAYGLSPWGAEYIANQAVIANPGCYATCALLSLIPLLKQQIISPDCIIIDAKSGASGAGRKANANLLFCEVAENFFPYKIGKHQHIPEIEQALLKYANYDSNITFVTHLLPIKTGIAMSIYLDASDDFNSDKDIANTIKDAYLSAYAHYPFVTFDEINQGNIEQDSFLLSLKHVVGTPDMHIGYVVDAGKIMLFATIDNLLKGAASQAIENMNVLYRLPVETGLKTIRSLS